MPSRFFKCLESGFKRLRDVFAGLMYALAVYYFFKDGFEAFQVCIKWAVGVHLACFAIAWIYRGFVYPEE